MSFYDAWDKPEPPTPAPANGTHIAPPGGASGYAAEALRRECDHIAALPPKSSRNDDLNTAAFNMGQLVGAGHIGLEEVRQALAQAARTAKLPEHEIRTCLRMSAGGGLPAGMEQPRHVPELPDDDLGTLSIADSPPAETKTFWDARPMLQHVYDFARARRCSPWATLGVVLARTVTTIPPWITLPPLVGSRASLNLFIALVGPSGAGKGAAEHAGEDAVNVGIIETGAIGSGEGLIHRYVHRETSGADRGAVIQDTIALFVTVPEIDTMAALGNRNGSTLMGELRKAWSGERLGFDYADPAKRLHVGQHAYRLTLILGVQPGRAQTLLDDADGGTPQRFVWLPTTDPDAPDEAPPEPAPRPAGRRNWGGVARCLDIPEEARQLIDTNRVARLRGDGETLDGHALLCREKVAAGLAVLDGRDHIDLEDWDLAGTIMTVSDRTRQGVVEHQIREAEAAGVARAKSEGRREIVRAGVVHDSAVARVTRLVLRKLQAEEGAMSYRDLRTNKIASRDRDHLDEAIDALVESGQVVVEVNGQHRHLRAVG